MPARSDKLFKRRKDTKSLSRRAAKIEPRRRILIVTEGEVTEVEYFESIKSQFNLVNVDLDICGRECDSSPTAVVKFALEKANSEGPHNKGGYNEVYCVFDRDEHEDFQRALSLVLDANKPKSSFCGGSIAAVVSYPCFEFWLLLHFTYTRSPFVASNGNSAAEMVTRELRKHPAFNLFEKSLTQKMLQALSTARDNAFKNAAKSLVDAKNTGEVNPSTHVHDLVLELVSQQK